MEWTISNDKIVNEELLSEYFMVAGKSLCIANHFEEKCHHIWRTVLITDAFRDSYSQEEIKEIATNLPKKILYKKIKGVCGTGEIEDCDIDLLFEAKDSRNYIAHSGASFGYLGCVSVNHIYKKVLELQPHVRIVIEDENLVSAWSQEICEREPAPRSFRASYPSKLEDWVFGDLLIRAKNHFDGL